MSPRPPVLEPEEFGRLVRKASDEELRSALAANAEMILGEIFRAMPGRLDGAAAAEADIVLEWRIAGVTDGDVERWQTTVRGGECAVAREGGERPSAVITLGSLEFVKLVAGAVGAPKLFMSGGLAVEGDLLAAARANTMFKFPGREE